MPNDQVIQLGTAITYIVAGALGAFLGVGFTAGAFMVFIRSILNSPAALKVIEGLVNSFPAETRELINIIAKFLDVISDGVEVEFTDGEVEG
jgi:hypothetical protein